VGNNIVVKPLDVVVGLAALVFLLRRRYQISDIRHQISKSILIFSLIGLVSLLINLTWLQPKELLAASFYLVRWVSYAAFAGIVWQFDEKFKKKLMAFLFFDGVFIVVAGFLQYFFFNSLKSFLYLGWDEHMHRIFSVFLDPNFAGAFFVLFFLFLVAAFYQHLQKRQKQEMLLVGIVLILTLIAIFLSFSRGALLSLIVGGATFFILIRKTKLLLALLGVMALYVVIVSPQFYDENMNLFRTASSEARIANDQTAFRFIHDRPLLGIGFNAYRYAKEAYGIQMGWVKAPSHADAGVDNSFIFVLATTGIIGFFAYLWMWFVILKRAYKIHKKNIVGVVVIASSAALFVNALFINSLFFAPLMLWMWVLVGIMEENVVIKSSSRKSSSV
jgi:O-antigen ligase